MYVTLIGTLLIALEIGGKPSKYDLAQIGMVFSGLVTLAEARDVMERRRNGRAQAAARQKCYNARKKMAN